MGAKGGRVATAALGAGVIGAAAEKRKQERNTSKGLGAIGSAVGGLVVNRDLASDGELHSLVQGNREQDKDAAPAYKDSRAASKSAIEKSAQQQSNLGLATTASPVKPAEIILPPELKRPVDVIQPP
ncbi:hypothetical protein VTK26DRAFT_3283 [Humicola hyalothermophila]